MRKISAASVMMLCLGFHASSVSKMLPTPVVQEELVGDGKVAISWSYSDEDVPEPYYHVIVYKMHKATESEAFTLAESDFGYIESTGTMTKHEERMANWDYVPDCPGWYAKWPVYMDGALGIDTFNYYAGADNDDVFGGAYLLSPEYDLTNVKDNILHVSCSLANEATSVSGGFCMYTWSTEFFDPKNYNFKNVAGQDYHYDTLNNLAFQDFEESLVPNEFMARTRLAFYGTGYSALWIDSFKTWVDMEPGDFIAYAAESNKVEEKSFTIDTSADTENDYAYAYQIRAIHEEYYDYTDMWSIRFVSELSPMKVIGTPVSGVQDIRAGEDTETEVVVRNGAIYVNGADTQSMVEVYSTDGRQVAIRAADEPVRIDTHGVYIVKVGNSTTKVVI